VSELITQLTNLARVTGAPESDLTIVAEGNIAVVEPGAKRF